MDDRHDSHASLADVRSRLLALLDDLIAHDGFGELALRTRWLKKDLKEILITSGKEYRFVIRITSGST